MKEALVTVIVPNLNGQRWLPGCLEALGRQRYRLLEAIIVDNGSTDHSKEIVQAMNEAYPHVRWRWLGLDRNYGFGVAVNRGIEAAEGEWIAFLNNDAAATPGWIEEMVRKGIDEQSGMVACKTLLMAQPDRLDKCGHLMFPDGLNRGRGSGRRDRGQWDAQPEALFPDGAAGLYRKAMLEEIGGMDEALFAYGDDSDMGMRALWAGWRCAYAPNAIAYHWRSATAGAYSGKKAYWVERNRIWLKWKLLPWPYLCIAPLFTLQRYAYQAWGVASGIGAAGKFSGQHGGMKLAMTLVKAHWGALMGIRRIGRERRRIMYGRRRTTMDMTQRLWRHRITAKELALGD